ncbi:hypothetical protein [Sinorhizobium fredii]|uniref:hypothetical protein n=1 Tax=Rhizobium fredii TaxID=380 RepID=UPI00129819AE|nr:hypothetical protein [Sinorhizobium fredii]MQW94045.1 hypothetical protein [Sinorhizobium fredii]
MLIWFVGYLVFPLGDEFRLEWYLCSVLGMAIVGALFVATLVVPIVYWACLRNLQLIANPAHCCHE